MDLEFTKAATFDKMDYTATAFPKGEYDGCTFMNCDFSGADISGSVFSRCEFSGCNLSLAKTTKTAFQDVQFKNCKMLGLQLSGCNEFGLLFSFEGCILDHSSFYRLKIKKTAFRNCKLEEVDFTEADLSAAVMEHCDLTGATFDHTVLEKADLRTAYHYSIDPAINRIKKARFSLSGIAGLLDKYDIEIEY
jgi:fluoroquinolone resistance protein